MPKISLTHLEMTLLFALFCSVALGITGKNTRKEQFQYAIYCFGSFVLAVFGLGWLMYLGHG
jgi:asparagine N-glycosylation enzyme membrane subunit Stt3